MTIIYGIIGKPVATIEDDRVFNADGEQIGFIEEDFLFATSDGECLGSYVNGVVYNGYGDAEAFREGATQGTAKLGPGLTATPPEKLSTGASVSAAESKPLPTFFERAQGNRRRNIFG